MKASEAFGAYATRPKELHGDWYLLSFHARLIGMELIALCSDPGDLRIPVGTDWATTLCAKMAVSGPDRRNAKAALAKLVDAGFLHVEPGFVRVTLDPVRSQSGSTSVPLRIHSGSTPDPKTTQVPENTNQEPLNKLVSKEESEIARTRESSARFERPPLGDPPPNVSPSDAQVPPWGVAWNIVQRVTGTEGQLGHPVRHREWLDSLVCASANDAGGQDHGPQFENAVERLVRAWMADPFVVKNEPRISNIQSFLEKRAAKGKAKPLLRAVDKVLTDDELLAMSEFMEFTLSLSQKQRRWELILAKERREDAERARAVGDAP